MDAQEKLQLEAQHLAAERDQDVALRLRADDWLKLVKAVVDLDRFKPRLADYVLLPLAEQSRHPDLSQMQEHKPHVRVDYADEEF